MGSALSTLGLGDNNNNKNNGIFDSGYNSALHCCDGVVDPLTLLAVLGTITAVTFYLRQLIIDEVPAKRKRRNVINTDIERIFLDFKEGNIIKYLIIEYIFIIAGINYINHAYICTFHLATN